MHRSTLVCLLVAALSGCLGGGPADPDMEGDLPTVPATLRPLRLTCPDGSPPTDPDACATTFEAGTVQGEPYVAVDPADPERQAVAYFERTADATGAWPLHVHRSDDGGRTWTSLPSPRPGAEPQSDPVVRFAADGALLVSGLTVAPGTQGARIDVWVARIDDGAIWRTTSLSSDGDNDRQWMGVGDDGTIVMLWQLPTTGAVVPHVSAATSTDHGRTWTTERVLVDACNTHTEPIVGDGGFWFACSRWDDALCRVPWYWSTLEGELSEVGCARDTSCGTNMVARNGERLLMTCLGPGIVTSSDDGGRNWTDHGTLQDLAPEATADGRTTPFWVAGDGTAWHVVLSNFAPVAEPTGALQSYSVAHLVLDSDLRPVEHTVLWEGNAGTSVQKGEFLGLAASPRAGLVAWVDGAHRVRTTPLAP